MDTAGCCFRMRMDTCWHDTRTPKSSLLITPPPSLMTRHSPPPLPSLDSNIGSCVACLILLASSGCKAIAQYPNRLVALAENMAEGLQKGAIKYLDVYPALLGEHNVEQLFNRKRVGWWMASHATSHFGLCCASIKHLKGPPIIWGGGVLYKYKFSCFAFVHNSLIIVVACSVIPVCEISEDCEGILNIHYPSCSSSPPFLLLWFTVLSASSNILVYLYFLVEFINTFICSFPLLSIL